MNEMLEKYFTIVRNFLPETEVKPTIGLDLGSNSCKAVELTFKDGSYELLNWVIEPISSDGQAVAVKRLLEKFETEQKDIFTAVSGQGTLIRYIHMPRMPEDDLKKSFALEADKYFPFAQDQIYTDCVILEPKSKENKMLVLAAAAKKEIVDQRMQLLKSANIETDYIGLTPIAIINAFTTFKAAEQKTEPNVDKSAVPCAEAILELGDMLSNLIIIKGKVPLFTRSISAGGKEINQRISNILGVPEVETEQLKSHPEDQEQNLINACESVLSNLLNEVRLSFDYFVTEHNVPVTKIYLTGGTALLKGISGFFSQNLEMSVEQWDPLSPLRISPKISREDLSKNINRMGVALGLAIKRND